ncbi:MAG: glycosyltransferase family 2 protein [Anaerolineales bacterium]|nr:glycosyltransferase family 2 protein [Anaerolineales bacterium]MCK5634568.1 glycosyltransferase family 2 protein [Anaerolineales bacterium]
MERSPKYSIVIRTFNEEKHIGRLLEGISRQTFRDAEIIIVDSGSTDATLAIANRYPVRVISITPEEFTFGRSLNRGCAETSGELLVFASAHVYPTYPDWLEKLLSGFDDPEVALVYGKQRGDSNTKFSENQIFAKLFPDQSNPRQDHPFCNNANAAIRRELWLQHPYDETLSGLEDLEWGKWALAEGHTLAYSALAEIIHIHEETPNQVYNRYRREALALKQIQPEEIFRFFDFVRLLIFNVVNDCRQALVDRVLIKSLGEIILFRVMQFWGTYKGLRHTGRVGLDLIHTFYYPTRSGKSGLHTDRGTAPIDYSLYED